MGEVILLFPKRGKTDTTTGWNRDIDPLEFGSDENALETFVSQQRSKETQRNYRREIERLFRWSNEIVGKPFCDLKPLDYDNYGKFIANPPADWCGNHIVTRMTADKVPFNGPLSANSQRTSFAVISSFVSFLVKHRYFKTVPLFKMPFRANNVELRETITERQLNEKQLRALLQHVYSQNNFDGIRTRFLISLGLLLGLRISEIAEGVMGNFFQSDGIWMYRVVGKGNKLAHIGVPKKLLEELITYRRAMNLPDLPERSDKQPLINVGSRRLSALFKSAVLAASESLPPGRDQEDMKDCSCHWLRHMYIKRLKKNRLNDEDVMALGRHESRKMSDLYNDSMSASRNAAIQDLSFDDVLLVD